MSTILLYGSDKKDTSSIFAIETITSERKQFSCESFKKNKATVLLFLSESCPICQKYSPTLRKLWSDFSKEGIGFYGVFPSTSIEIDSVKVYSKKFDIDFPLLIDSSQIISSLLKAKITPEVVVLSVEGVILYRGRIDNLFPSIGRKRYVATVHDLREALDAITNNHPIQIKQTDAVGCFIEF